jgi:hypothetical protein
MTNFTSDDQPRDHRDKDYEAIARTFGSCAREEVSSLKDDI